jgi:hypothetical protein
MLKILIKLQFLLLLTVMAVPNVCSQTSPASQPKTLLVISKDGKYGFADLDGKVVIEPKFDEVQEDFSEGFAWVKLNDKYGFVNLKGQVAIPLKFDAAVAFSEELSAVKLNNGWGFINKNGEFVITPTFVMAQSFSEGLAVVARLYEDARYKYFEFGYIDKKGALVIPYQFFYADNFKNGVAQAVEPIFSTAVYIDKTGKIITRIEGKSYNYNNRGAGWAGNGAGAAYPTAELKLSSVPVNAEVFLIPLFDWESDNNIINDDRKLAKHRVPTGNTETTLYVKQQVYVAVFIRDGRRKWVQVDIPRDRLATVTFP